MNLRKELSIGLFASTLALGSLAVAGCAGKQTETKSADEAAKKGEMANCGADHAKKGSEKGGDASCGANGCGANGCGANGNGGETK